MRKIISGLCTLIWIAAGIAQFIFYLGALQSWIGGWGVLVAILTIPGIVIFPVIYWIVEGIFPVAYFIILGVGIAALFISNIARKD